MLVRLVSAVLQRFLGHYVENLDTERLSYSLGYSGNVVLTNLRLKPNSLNHILGTPLRLTSGHIARVQLIIPLTQLRSQPWSIIIEDAELIINPYNSRDNSEGNSRGSDSPDGSKEPAHEVGVTDESRKAYLDRLESRWWQLIGEGGLVDAVTTSPNDSSWWSYGVSLVYGIVSNLHVEIRNVNFTFVDDANIISRSLTWGMRLSRMTIQATDESWNPSGRSSNQHIEFKSIDIEGLSVFYYDLTASDSPSTPQERFLIQPTKFSVHLLRRTTPESLTNEMTPRIEVEAQLTTFRVDVSHGVLVYARQLTNFLKQQAIPPHRPTARPDKQSAAWWRYAAGEVVPALRRYHTQWSSGLALQQLAEAAALNNRYVRAYQAHLLRGLGLQDEEDSVDDGVEYQEIEKSMSLDRVALLRQVAMQRAARQLKQRRLVLTRTIQEQSPNVPTQPSQSWWPSFLFSSTTAESTEPKSPDEVEVPRPWRLWWWFSAAPEAVADDAFSERSELQAEVSASSSEAALMLLNELVAARDVGQVLTRDRLFCRITARVDQFQLYLMEEADLSICSLHADNLQLCVETRPREESLHFKARLHSLLLRDDRSRVDSQGFSQLPLFPNIISPLPHTVLESSSPPNASDLFRLDYITSRADDDPNLSMTPPGSLSIRTDPLRVICQPELFLRVMHFFSSTSIHKSSKRTRTDPSAYDTLKSQTKANLRAVLHTVEEVDKVSALPLPKSSSVPSKSVSSDPSDSSRLSLAYADMGARPNRLRVRLDIAAPRILLPERLWPASSEESTPTPHLLGVIFDFGRFRLSNWEPTDEKEGNTDQDPSFSNSSAKLFHKERESVVDNAAEDSEDSEAFATPCGTPLGSDSEDLPLRQSSARRRRLKRNRQLRLYETYLLELDEFRILAGRLDELQVSGLWPDLLPAHSSLTTEDGRHITQVTSQVNLVDRFSLAIWITRRVVSMASLRTACPILPSPPPTIPADLPGLLVCLEQRHCVLRLSDSRLSALCRCVGAVTSIASSASNEMSESVGPSLETAEILPQTILSRNPSIRFKVPTTKLSSDPRRTVVVTFSMQELILQLDARGRPLAEFRLVSTAARFNRFTNVEHSKTTYDVCLQVHSLTVADALCGLGGDFDLLAASHRDVRLDTLSGSLNVTSPRDGIDTPPRCHPASSGGDKTPTGAVISRPFYDPIGEESDEDASTALIRVKYLLTKTEKKVNRNIDVKFRHLDLLGNLNTLLELIAFARYVMPYSEPESKSTEANKFSNETVDFGSATTTDDETDKIENLEMSISVERLSLVLIRVKIPNTVESTEECLEQEGLKTATAERLATITLLGANFQSRENHKDLRVSLAGLQVLDLMDVEKPSSSGVRHRHIFVAGRCLDPEISDVALTWSGAKSVFTLTARRHATSGYNVELDVTSPVYVHNPRVLHEISTWLSNLYHWNAVVDALARKLAESAMSVETLKRQKEQSKTIPSLASLHAVFEQPVVVFPAGPTSPKVLIARLGRLTLKSDSSESSSSFSLVELIIARASLSAFDIETGVPRVRGTSEVVQAMLVLAHYLRLLPSIDEHYVLADISADLTLKQEVLHRPNGKETDSEVISWPEGFDSSEVTFPFNEEAFSEVQETLESSLESWITVSACLTQPLHVRLSKRVYCQLLQTLDNLMYSGETSIKPSDPEEVRESSSTLMETEARVSTSSRGLAMRFRMPRLVVETFTEMGGEKHPLGLTRFTLSEFFIAASMRSPAGSTHIESTLASLLLENLLPDYRDENRYLLYSHLPANSGVVNRPVYPRADSCPDLSQDECQPSVLGGPYGVKSRNFNRPSLSFSEKHGARKRKTKSKRPTSTDGRQGNQTSDGGKVESNSMDQFVRIRVLMVDKNCPTFNSKYQSTHRFIDVAFSSLTCYLSLHPWVLLLDFLGLGSPITACDDFENNISSISKSTSLSNSDTTVQIYNQDGYQETVTLTVTSLSVATFSLLLDTVSPEASPLLQASANQLCIHLTNYSRSIEAGGDWMHLAGHLAAVSVLDLTPKGGRLYSRRFLTNCVGGANGEGDYLIFALTKHQLPDPDANRRSDDGKLELQLGPAYYIHTQEFLGTAIETLDRFLQYQDLMNKVRASSEGYKVRQGAAISMRLRLDIKADAPIVLLPVSVESENVLVCNLGTVTAVNDFYWHTDLIENEEACRGDDPLRDQPQKQSACKHCTSSIWWSDEYSSSTSKNVMTQGVYCSQEAESASENIGGLPCLLDRIHLSLEHIEIYIGKRHDVKDVLDANGSRTLDFGDFCIMPEEAALTEPFGLTAVVERNLCGARELHAVPDWRLSARLRATAPVRVGLREYRILRGILSHNVGGGSSSNSGSSVVGYGVSGWSTTAENREAIHTRRPYRSLAFTFDLEDVAICLSVPSDWASQRHLKDIPTQNAPFCRLELAKSRLVYDSYSCGKHITDLACSVATFTDTRFEGLSETHNCFSVILSALLKHQNNIEGDLPASSPQFRVTQVVTPVGTADIGGVNVITTATNNSMTFNLRSMRLILALDWLVDFHRFLTTQPMHPSSSTMDVSNEPSPKCEVNVKSNSEASSQLHIPKGTSDLRVFSDQTEFVLMENPSQADTNVVVLTGAMCFLLRSGGSLSQALMHLCLHGVGLHTLHGFLENSRAVIIEPTDLTVALLPHQVINKPSRPFATSVGLQDLVTPRASLEIQTSTLRTHFSYTDSLLFFDLINSIREQAAYAFGGNEENNTIKPKPSTAYDPLVTRLVEMGFSAEDAFQTLQSTGGQIDAAIVLLTSPSPPSKNNEISTADPPSSRTVRFLRDLIDQLTPYISEISFHSGFSLCLIDDCIDADVPLAEIKISDISLKWNLTGWAIGRVMGRLSANYYNRDLSALEPAIESFLGVCDWRLRSDEPSKGDCAIIEVHSPDIINVNLTVALVRLTKLILAKVQSPQLSRRRLRAPFTPFCLCNQTGETLRFKKVISSALTLPSLSSTSSPPVNCDDEFEEWTPVEPGATVQLPFQSPLAATGRGQSMVGNRKGIKTPRLLIQVEGWSSAYPVALDRLGVFSRIIRLQQDANPHLVPATRLVIEIVRRGSAQNLITVRSGLTFTNRLSPRLAIEVGLAHLPTSSTMLPTSVIKSGLQVAFGETQALPLSLAARRENGERLCFRPVLIGPDGSDDTSAQPSVLFEWSHQITFENDTQKEGGGIKVATSLSETMDWRRLSKPGEFDECVMSCRCLKSGREIGLYSATSVSPKHSPNLLSKTQSFTPWQFCVTVVRDAFPSDPAFREASVILPGHHLTLGPVLRIVNLLPCEMTYFLEGTPIRARIPPNKAASVFEISCSDVVRFGVHLENFQICETIHIPPTTFSDTVLINLYDQYKRLLQLKAEICTRGFGARHVTISAVCWLINHSGLPLVFAAQAPSSLACAAEWRAPNSSEHRALAAGQSEEQEIARFASPLLFSPTNDFGLGVAAAPSGSSGGSNNGNSGGNSSGNYSTSSWSLQVRLGAMYAPSDADFGWIPRWSSPVTLDKSGDEIRLRLKAGHASTSSRPDLLYSVGVEVRKGAGLHSTTTIVTFVPRFLISNQTNFQLQYAQRFCLDSKTHNPLYVYPQCNVPFHWPRQDLDQLLCFRALIPGEPSPHQQASDVPLVATNWSGCVQIDKPRSYHLILRLSSNSQASSISSSPSETLFLRVDIVLRGGTLFVIISDATHLPPPYRIENRSPVALYYQQAVDSHSSANAHHGSDILPKTGVATQEINGRWNRGILLNRLPPRSIVSYAPEEPLLPPRLSVGVAGELSNVYDLSKPGVGSQLVYTNCIYIGVCGVAGDNDSKVQPLDSLDTCYNSRTFEFPVLDVISESSRRVVLRQKRPGERSQLWYKSSQGFLVHEGSVAPQAPSSVPHRGRVLSTRSSWVLDIDTSESVVTEALIQCGLDSRQTLENFEVGILCLARLSTRRRNTQTWNFNRGFLINAASFCIQAERCGRVSMIHSSDAVFVARPRIRAVNWSSSGVQSFASTYLGVARIFFSWLRPGSGSLHVEIVTEGPVRILRISDPQEPPHKMMSVVSKHSSRVVTLPTSMNFLLDLPYGFAVSIISARSEELCYASFQALRFAIKRFYPGAGSHKLSTASRSAIDVGQEVTGNEELIGEDDDDEDVVFVDDSSEISQPISIENDSLTPYITADRPIEQIRLYLGRIQIDNQIGGTSLPVLLFRSVSTNSTAGVIEGRPLRTLGGSDWVPGRELERLFYRVGEDPKGISTSTSEQSIFMNNPSLVLQSMRLLHTGWKAEIFDSLELRINRMVIQAEERLLLKLIQFSRHFRGSSLSPAIISTEDAKSIDFLNQTTLEAEGSYSRQVLPPSISSRHFLYFDRLRVLFAPIRVTVHTAEGRLGPEFYDVQRLLPKLLSFTDADLRLGEFERGHCLESAGFLTEQLLLHFETKLRAQALRIFGSVDALGNPLGLMSDLSSGISDLADMDFTGMVRNVAHGVGDSTAKVVGSMSQLVHTLSMDERHQRRRMAIMSSPNRGAGSVSHLTSSSNHNSSNSTLYGTEQPEEKLDEFELTVASSETGRLNQGMALAAEGMVDGGRFAAPLKAGLRGFVHGMVGGVTSIVTQPIHGVCEEDSFKGFVYGIGRGLLGTVTKPVGGVLDLVSGAMTSLREAARPSSSGRPLRMRPRRALATPLRSYSLAEAVGQLLLRRVIATHPQTTSFKNHYSNTVVSLEDLNELAEGFSISRLLKASEQPFEDDTNEVVIRVCKCQSAGVSVIITNRALWCLRNFSLSGVRLVSNPLFGNDNRDATSVMFVIPYVYLNAVCLSDRAPVTHGASQRFSVSKVEVPKPENSYYLEFQMEKGRRNLRFDEVSWAQDVISELAEAHFRFVQSVMELRRGRPIDMMLRTHPLALPFAPSLITSPEPNQTSKKI